MKRKTIILFLCVFSIIGIYSCIKFKQTDITKHYTESSFIYAEDLCKKQGRYKEAIAYIDSIYKNFPSISIADKYQYYFFHSRLTDSSLSKETNIQRSISYTDSMQLIIEENGLKEKMGTEYAAAFRLKGEFCMTLGKYDEAFKAVSMCKFLSLQGGDSCNTGINTATLGFIAYRQKKYSQAVDYYKESISLFGSCKNGEDRYYQMQQHLDDLALSYAQAGQLDSAIKYYKIAETYILQNKALSKSNATFPYVALMVVYGNAANSLMAKKEYDSSKYYLDKSININALYIHDSTEAAMTELQLAELYLNMGNFQQAYAILNKGKSIIFSLNDEAQLYWLRLMPEAANKTGNIKEELKYTKLLHAKRDSVIENQIKILQSDPNIEYERIQKRHEVDLLKKNNEIQRTYITASIFIVVLFLALALVIFLSLRRSKILKEKERKDELFLQELRLQMEYNNAVIAQRRKISNDMHDELSSSLAALKFYVEDVKGKISDADSKGVLTDISAEVGSVYENARRYMHNLQANTGEIQYDLVGFLTDMSKDFLEKKLLDIRLDIDKEKIKTILGSFQHDHLYHIIRESIANIIKHAQATEINIKINFTDHLCQFIVADNGKGFDESKIENGIGLNSIKTRINELEGSLEIDSSGDGTVLKGEFPVF